MSLPLRIGVLAIQGAVSEHERALRAVGAEPVRVRDARDLDLLDGLVIPGGETTTLRRVAGDSGLIDALAGPAPRWAADPRHLCRDDRVGRRDRRRRILL